MIFSKEMKYDSKGCGLPFIKKTSPMQNRPQPAV